MMLILKQFGDVFKCSVDITLDGFVNRFIKLLMSRFQKTRFGYRVWIVYT